MLIIIWKIQTKQNVKNMLMFKGGNITANFGFLMKRLSINPSSCADQSSL